MSNTIFTQETISQIEHAVKVLREVQDGLAKIYWEKHKEITTQSYASTTEQLYELAKLGELAKGMQTLKQATSDIYCFSIMKK